MRFLRNTYHFLLQAGANGASIGLVLISSLGVGLGTPYLAYQFFESVVGVPEPLFALFYLVASGALVGDVRNLSGRTPFLVTTGRILLAFVLSLGATYVLARVLLSPDAQMFSPALGALLYYGIGWIFLSVESGAGDTRVTYGTRPMTHAEAQRRSAAYSGHNPGSQLGQPQNSGPHSGPHSGPMQAGPPQGKSRGGPNSLISLAVLAALVVSAWAVGAMKGNSKNDDLKQSAQEQTQDLDKTSVNTTSADDPFAGEAGADAAPEPAPDNGGSNNGGSSEETPSESSRAASTTSPTTSAIASTTATATYQYPADDAGTEGTLTFTKRSATTGDFAFELQQREMKWSLAGTYVYEPGERRVKLRYASATSPDPQVEQSLKKSYLQQGRDTSARLADNTLFFEGEGSFPETLHYQAGAKLFG